MEQIKEAVYLINDERYLHLRENGAGVGFATYNKVTGEPLESGQISEKNLPPDGQNTIPAARNWYLFELSDDDRKAIQQESVKILENIPQAGIGRRRIWEPETFMTEIKEMISSLVTTTEAAKGANALMKNKIIGICPNCGANVVEREKGWFCENRECRFVLWKDNAFLKRLGKRMDAHVADKLLRDGRVRLKDCKSAKGKTYNATVLLATEADGRSKFSLEFEGGC